ncbi:MAG: hypothetical protein ACR2IS_07660 [Nitrososphaeraceae archaeon]
MDDMTRGDWTIEDWREMSLRGEACRVFGCRNTPSNQCRKCHVHYCSQDISNLLHPLTDDEIRDRDRRDQSLR